MAKSRNAPRGGGRKGKPAKDTTFEVEDQDELEAAAAGPGGDLETALVFVTLIALVVGIILAQVELSGSYGQGLFG